ncbi:acetyl-CoA carboxylase biotin carboxyl carrier protein [Paraburkholderia bannensis]|uniref:acetyl-CoA carboxylase biotin carboxyl carrier protein n=1 Tax=Paraburkholderia bannensis TaxID=765414 RepID=UPI002AC338AE|nr:biotin/lipoyl-containing protein [Paraburkholderia bannensis]
MTLQTQADIRELRQITAWLVESGVEFIEFGRAKTLVRLTLEPAGEAVRAFVTPPQGESPNAQENGSGATNASAAAIEIRAPLAGQFLAAHPARNGALASVGTQVAAGDVLGLVRVADLCVPVVTASPGIVVALLAEAGTTVGYGAPLFSLSPPCEAAATSA